MNLQQVPDLFLIRREILILRLQKTTLMTILFRFSFIYFNQISGALTKSLKKVNNGFWIYMPIIDGSYMQKMWPT